METNFLVKSSGGWLTRIKIDQDGFQCSWDPSQDLAIRFEDVDEALGAARMVGGTVTGLTEFHHA